MIIISINGRLPDKCSVTIEMDDYLAGREVMTKINGKEFDRVAYDDPSLAQASLFAQLNVLFGGRQ